MNRGAEAFAPERKAMPKDNALSFVGQIMTAHKAVLKADGEALKHAIECGKYLNLAKENVLSTKPKGKWLRWLEEHCRDIHRNTAALYMRLAENADAIADCTSIREADMKLRQPKPGECGSDESDSDSDESDAEEVTDEEADEAAQRVVQAGAAADLADLLQALAVDEVCTALIDAWDEDHIRELCDRLRGYFTKPAQQTPDDLGIPPASRRPPPPQPTH
jgi:hypothetical protein